MATEDQWDIYSKLSYFAQKGIALYVDNRSASPEEALRCYEVHEKHTYMPDYIYNESGKLTELRLDRVQS